MWISVLIYSLFMSTSMKENEASVMPNDNKKGTLLYVFDPLCGWCFGFTPVMENLEKKLAIIFAKIKYYLHEFKKQKV